MLWSKRFCPKADGRSLCLYYYLFGTGSIYYDGWKASFGYRPDFLDLFVTYPPPKSARNMAGKEVWELYHVDADPTELRDLAKSKPDKLAEMQALFAAEATANHVYPLINWTDLYPRFQRLLQPADPAAVTVTHCCEGGKADRQP